MITTALKVLGIDHVVLHVRDLPRAKKFYTDVLGMTVEIDRPSQVFLRCGQQEIALFQAKEGSPVHAGSEMNHMALKLASGSYEEVKAALEAAGCQVSGRPSDPHCIYFTDPEGHRLQLLTPAEQQR